MASGRRTTSKYPWTQIRAEYVEAPSEAVRPRLEDLADKHGLPRGHIYQRAAEEQWVEAAEGFLRNIETTRRARVTDKLASEGADIDSKCHAIARQAIEQVEMHFEQAIRLGIPLRPQDLEILMRALERVQNITRMIDGRKDSAINTGVVKILLPHNGRDALPHGVETSNMEELNDG